MNGFMGQALGNALMRVGDIWGPERLKEQREQAEARRRQQLADTQMEESRLNMEHARSEEGRRAARHPVEMGNLERAGKVDDARLRQLNFEISELERKRAAEPEGWLASGYQHEIDKRKAELRALDANIAQSQAAAAASRASTRTHGLQDEVIAEQLRELRDPRRIALRESEPDIKRVQQLVGQINEDVLRPVRVAYDPMTGFYDQTKAPGANPAIMEALKKHAEFLAEGLISRYEAEAMNRKQPAWGRPEHRAQAIAEQARRILGVLITTSGMAGLGQGGVASGSKMDQMNQAIAALANAAPPSRGATQ